MANKNQDQGMPPRRSTSRTAFIASRGEFQTRNRQSHKHRPLRFLSAILPELVDGVA
jgi:hypothetical protein